MLYKPYRASWHKITRISAQSQNGTVAFTHPLTLKIFPLLKLGLNAYFGEGTGLSQTEKEDLARRGAIFDDASGDRESAYSPVR